MSAEFEPGELKRPAQLFGAFRDHSFENPAATTPALHAYSSNNRSAMRFLSKATT
jgi:hypothetical protein